MSSINVERMLARVLWSFSQADGGATAIMRDLCRNALLTDAERERARLLAREETSHANVSAGWAIKLGMPKPPSLDPYAAIALRDTMVVRRVGALPLRTAWTLAGLRWNEEQSVRAFPRWIRLFAALGQSDMVKDFTALTDEERSHVAFGRRTSERLDVLPGFTNSYDHYYRMTAHAGVGILASSFSGTLAKLETAAGLRA